MVEDIRVDDEGNLRCASCGGKNFHGRRTARAHIIGWVTVGVGALATQKRLRCQQCGAYNKQGNAKPWKDKSVSTGAMGRRDATRPGPGPPGADARPIRVDDGGDQRCWFCGFSGFYDLKPREAGQEGKRCNRCGQENQLADPLPWEGPESTKNWD